MTVKGTINPSYYYYVLFNVNNTPGPNRTAVTGPVPVVGPPYGNGFAAGAFTNYVEYNGGVPGGTGFGFYAISADLLQPKYLGSTGYLVTSAVSPGNTLSFQIPLAQLAPSGLTVDGINQLEVNFVATNVVNVIGDSLSTPKYFDALNLPTSTGSFVDINVRTAGGAVQQGLYQDSLTNNEGPGDVAQAGNGVPQVVTGTVSGVTTDDLDITDWSLRLNPQ